MPSRGTGPPSSRHARAAGEAIVAGVVAALAWAVIAYGYLRARQWLRFRGLAGRYRVERKFEPEVMCEAMTVEVSGNVLTATARDYQDGPYEATIAMSTDLPNSGRGHYTRDLQDRCLGCANEIMHPCIPQTSELRTQKDVFRMSLAMMW